MRASASCDAAARVTAVRSMSWVIAAVSTLTQYPPIVSRGYTSRHLVGCRRCTETRPVPPMEWLRPPLEEPARRKLHSAHEWRVCRDLNAPIPNGALRCGVDRHGGID